MSLYLGDKPIANDGSHNTANVDLSNLSNTGEAHFANPSLSNLSAAGQAILNGKADINLSNLNNTGNAAASNLNSKGIRTVFETYRNGENWYRVWSDGWIEQGGVITASYANAGQTINLLKPFTNTNYTINVSAFYAADLPDGSGSYGQSLITFRSTTSFGTAQTGSKVWYACGY